MVSAVRVVLDDNETPFWLEIGSPMAQQRRLILQGNEVDGIGGDDAVEGRQREMPGHIGLEEAEAGPGEEPLHSGVKGLQTAPIAIDGNEVYIRPGDVAHGEREGAAAGAEVGPDAATIPLDSRFDQSYVIGVIHQTVPLEGVDRTRTRA